MPSNSQSTPQRKQPGFEHVSDSVQSRLYIILVNLVASIPTSSCEHFIKDTLLFWRQHKIDDKAIR